MFFCRLSYATRSFLLSPRATVANTRTHINTSVPIKSCAHALIPLGRIKRRCVTRTCFVVGRRRCNVCAAMCLVCRVSCCLSDIRPPASVADLTHAMRHVWLSGLVRFRQPPIRRRRWGKNSRAVACPMCRSHLIYFIVLIRLPQACGRCGTTFAPPAPLTNENSHQTGCHKYGGTSAQRVGTAKTTTTEQFKLDIVARRENERTHAYRSYTLYYTIDLKVCSNIRNLVNNWIRSLHVSLSSLSSSSSGHSTMQYESNDVVWHRQTAHQCVVSAYLCHCELYSFSGTWTVVRMSVSDVTTQQCNDVILS